MERFPILRDSTASPVKINETHLCILVKDKRSLIVRYLPIDSYFESLTKELDKLKLSSPKALLRIQEVLEIFDKKCLLHKRFHYCDDISDSFNNVYEKLTPITKDFYEKTIKEIQDTYKKLHYSSKWNTSVEKYVNDNLQKIAVEYKNNIMKRIKCYSIEKSYQKCESDSDILAFSHRISGWKVFEFTIDKDFSFYVKSNFGYGRSSYFYEIVKYKDVDIIPYSDWITYHYADFRSIGQNAVCKMVYMSQ